MILDCAKHMFRVPFGNVKPFTVIRLFTSRTLDVKTDKKIENGRQEYHQTRHRTLINIINRKKKKRKTNEA